MVETKIAKEISAMTIAQSCPKCGAAIAPGAPAGQCPKCLLKAGFESASISPSASEATGSGAAGRFQPPSVDELAGRFPQLEILEILGKGGMGAVYKARQKQLDRLVAIKILPPEVGSDSAFAERFSREARALARLSHPNIVAVYDSGQVDGLYYFIMEYVDGVNLRQTIQAGRLKPQEALAIVPQICDALQFAHDGGVVHRDIKPENVLVDTKGRVKIADFGLAKLLGREPADLSLTRTEQVMGTPRYMAPEQFEATSGVDHRADIYSLGVVFYELLTGEVPMGRFAPPSKMVQVDVRLDEIVLRTLEREPERRYQRASEIKTAVETLSDMPSAAVADKPGLDSAPPTVGDSDVARQEVKIPAIGLVIVGILSLLTAVVPVLLCAGLLLRFLAMPEGMPRASEVETQAAVSLSHSHAQSHPTLPTAPATSDASAEESLPPSAEGQPSVRIVEDNTAMPAESASAVSETWESAEGHGTAEVVYAPATWSILIMLAVILCGGILPILLGVLLILGGCRMLRLQSHGLAITASILALLPCHPASILGMVFGIWSLVVLNRPEIKAAFGRATPDSLA